MRALIILFSILVLTGQACLAENDQGQLNGQLGSGVPSIKFDEQTLKAMQSQTNNTFGKQSEASPYAKKDESSQSAEDMQQMMTGVYGDAIKAQTNLGQGNGSSKEIGPDYNDIQAAIENAYKQAGQQAQGSPSGN